jgi:hypothetical protein
MFRGHHPRTGFRFSVADLVAIIVCVAITLALRKPLGDFTLLFPITLGHFFLFCNVFRIRRYLELTWAVLFITNIVLWTFTGHFSWLHVLATQTPVTMLAITVSLCSKDYHGIGTAWIQKKVNSQCLNCSTPSKA